MIRFLSLILLMTLSIVANAQAPSNYTNINGRYRWIAGMFDSTFHIPKGTTPSLRTGGSTNPGAIFYNTTDSSVYTYTGTQWIKLRGSINPSDTTNKYVTQVYKKTGSDSIFYVKGGSHIFAFIDSVGSGGGGGGGGGKIYYFNGGVSMGTFGGFTMYELGDTAVTSTAANFTRSTNGNIANFITDPGKPGLLSIPAGVWTIDAYLSETGGGSNNAEIYVQVEKWDGSTITTIATSPIEQITNGNVIDLYTWSVSIPTTSLAITDRIIIQFYIQNTNGKTVTLYTQNGLVGEVHTTFTTGIGALNGLTAASQFFATGTSGTDFNIASATATHTFNLPTASATNRGALSSADWTAFNNKGSVSSVATNNATGITGGTITTTGTLAIDTTVISTRLWRQKGIDSVQSNLTAGLALKVNISDTASMLLPYLRKADTTAMLSPYLRAIDTASLSNRINLKVNISDTASMLSPYLRKVDTASLSNRINTKLNISDTATMLGNYLNNVGYGLTKASQVVSADSATLSAYYLRRKDSLTSTNLLGYVTRTVLADSAAAIRAGSGTISGSGTTNRISKFTASGTIGNSSIADSSSSVAMTILSNGNIGINRTAPSERLEIVGTSRFTRTTSPSVHLNISMENGFAEYDARGSIDHVWENSGVERMRLTLGGNLGIGTASPDSMLTVLEGARFQRGVRMSGLPSAPGTRALRIDANGTLSVADTTTGGGGISGSGTTNYIPKFTSSSAIGNSNLQTDASGNVGLGVTPSAWGSNYKVLESGNGSNGVGGALAFFNTGTNGAILYSNAYNNNTNDIYSYTAPAAKFAIENNLYKWFQAAQGTAGNNITFTQAMTLDASGNLNVGTTTSASKVNVSNKLRLWDTTPTGAGGSNVMGYMFNTSSVPAGTFIEDVGTGIILSMGVNSVQSGSRTTSVVGGLFRMDTRSTQQEFTVIGVPTGGSTESQRLGVNLQNGNTILAPVAGNVGVGISAYATMGSKLQVNGNAAIGYSASTAAPTNGLAVSGDMGIGTASPSKYNHGGTNRFLEIYNTATSADAQAHLLLSTGASANTGSIGSVTFALPNTAGAEKRGAIIQGLIDANSSTSANVRLEFLTANAGSLDTRMLITPAGNIFIGNGTVAASPATAIISGTGGTGTNVAGAEFRIRGGASTGSGAGGPITFYTAAAGASGTTVRAATEVGRFTSAGDFGIGTTTPNSKLHVAGSVRLPITTKTTTYTLDATDYTVVFNLNGNATANLPDATTIPGRIYVIKINRTNVGDTLTIDPNGAQTIDGAATLAIQCQYAVTIQSDGTNWRIIGDYAQGINCL